MITPEEKARIARENGAKSHGPTSPEGKEKVSQNSTRHGFFSKRIIIPGESEAIYAKLAQAYLEFLKPESLVEIDLVTDIINSRWLIRRAEQLTTTAYWAAQDKLKAESESFANQSPDRLQYACFQQAIEGKNYLEILATMKEKHERGYHRALSRLERLRKRKQPLPDISPTEIEKEFPENSDPKPPSDPHPTTSTNVEIKQANQHESSPTMLALQHLKFFAARKEIWPVSLVAASAVHVGQVSRTCGRVSNTACRGARKTLAHNASQKQESQHPLSIYRRLFHRFTVPNNSRSSSVIRPWKFFATDYASEPRA